MDPATTVILDGLSDVGVKRLNNEDAWWSGQLGGAFSSMEARAPEALRLNTAEGPVLLAVSDGIGGASAGEVASQIAVTAVARELNARRGLLAQPGAGRAVLLEAMHRTHHAIRSKAREPGCAGMGATLSLLCFAGGAEAWWGQAGDSRIYLQRQGRLRQVSHDHSPVGRMRQAGRITEEEARRHPIRNQIDQSLGDSNCAFHPDAASVAIESGDIFLLCSDGLTDGLWDREIEQFLAAIHGPDDIRATVECLIAAAKQTSGRDNITAVIASVEPQAPAAAPPHPSTLAERMRSWWAHRG